MLPIFTSRVSRTERVDVAINNSTQIRTINKKNVKCGESPPIVSRQNVISPNLTERNLFGLNEQNIGIREGGNADRSFVATNATTATSENSNSLVHDHGQRYRFHQGPSLPSLRAIGSIDVIFFLAIFAVRHTAMKFPGLFEVLCTTCRLQLQSQEEERRSVLRKNIRK